TDMSDQVLRAFRNAVRVEIGRRRNSHQSPVRPDPHRDHVFLDALAQPHTGVETFLDDIAECAVEDQLDADVGIGAEHRLQLGPYDAFERVVGQGQPDRARWLFAERGQRRDLFLYFRDARGERREQSSPGGGRGDVAGGAREEPYAHARFELLDRVAQRRL